MARRAERSPPCVPSGHAAHAVRLCLSVGSEEASESALPFRPPLPEQDQSPSPASLCADVTPSHHGTRRILFVNVRIPVASNEPRAQPSGPTIRRRRHRHATDKPRARACGSRKTREDFHEPRSKVTTHESDPPLLGRGERGEGTPCRIALYFITSALDERPDASEEPRPPDPLTSDPSPQGAGELYDES